MNIGIIYEVQEKFKPDERLAPDDYAEWSSEDEIYYLSATLDHLGHRAFTVGGFEQLLDFLNGPEKVDLVFNYAAGIWGQAREAQAPSLLEALRIPYTGAGPFSLALCMDKAIVKRLWRSAGLPTPDFFQAACLQELEQKAHLLPGYPVFVKPAREGSSKGIAPESRVASPDALQRRVAWILKEYRQPALVETYLPGREYTAGILGGGQEARVLGVVEVANSAKGIVDLADKKAWQPHTFRPVADANLRSELAFLALEAYRAVECDSIGRVDLRLDREGCLQLLEINPNPGLHPSRSAMPAIAMQAGLPYPDLIDEIVKMGMQRGRGAGFKPGNGSEEQETRPAGLAYRPSRLANCDVYVKNTCQGRGFGVYAAKDVRQGEVILESWGKIIPFQTEHSVQIGWDLHLEVELPVRYLNHSCEPNLGVKTNGQGFPDFIALRDIPKDAELTYDYAMTEYTHYKRPRPELEFDLTCKCGAPGCRGKLGYYSELPDHLKEKYRDWVSDYLVL